MITEKECNKLEKESSDVERLKKLTKLDYERQAAENAAGKEESVYGIPGFIWKLICKIDSKKRERRFKKKTYMWLMLFTGWFGGHRWYQGRRLFALFETLFFWSGIPMILLLTDFMEVFPVKPDKEGYIML